MNPADHYNYALTVAAGEGHIDVCSLLLTEPRVLARYRNNPINLPTGVIVPPPRIAH